MAARVIQKRLLTQVTLSCSSLLLLATAACALEPSDGFSQALGTCADSAALNQAVWSDNGIIRRQAQNKLAACGPEHWNLRVLMAPLQDLAEYERDAAWINIYAALDPLAVANPERITVFLLGKAQSSDPEQRRLAIEGLGPVLGTRFVSSSLSLSQPALLRGLNDTDARVRRAAAYAVGSVWMGSQSALAPLAAALLTRTGDVSPDVRVASLQAIAGLSEMNNTGNLQPPVSMGAMLQLLQQKLDDPVASVRLQAVVALAHVWDENLSIAHKQLRQQLLLGAIQDDDLDVVVAAAGADNINVAIHAADASNPYALVLDGIAQGIQSGSLPEATIAAVLSPELMKVPSGDRLVRELALSPNQSLRVQAQRVLNATISRSGATIPNDQVASSIITFGQGLNAPDPVIQLDAISGLSELNSGLKSLAPVRRILASPLPPLRWAAAIAISSVNPKDESTFEILREILATSSDDNLRATASSNLRRSESANAARILAHTAQRENRTLYYVRSCTSLGPELLPGQEIVAVDAIAQPTCRRAVAESFSFLISRSEPDVVKALLRISETRDHEQRFNAIYALGSMADHTDVTSRPRMSNRIAAVLMPITRNQQEHPEVRRIAATMLHLHRQPMPDFFSAAGLPSPSTVCANAPQHRQPGFRFDPYEGRCMYDTATGCGDGLPEVYSALRRMLAPKKAP